MRGWVERWWWAAAGAVVLGAGLAVDRAQEVAAPPVAVHEAVLCAVAVEDGAVPAVAASPRTERVEVPMPDQDPRCDDLAGAPGAGALQVHDESADAAGTVTVSGRLVYEQEPACFHLDAAEGPLAVLWPRGTGARFDPARLTGPDGTTLASVGSTIRLRGRYVEGAARRCGPVDDGAMAFLAGAVTGR